MKQRAQEKTFPGTEVTKRRKKGEAEFKPAKDGFTFGAARVSAAATDERGYAFILVDTKRAAINVQVTPSGLLRVWMNGMQVLATK